MVALPAVRDFITTDDVKAWVTAATDAALPRITIEMRDLFDDALAKHGAIIQDMTRKNLQVIESQGRAMQQTMSTMNRLVAFGALSMGMLEYWRWERESASYTCDKPETRIMRRLFVLGVFGVLFAITITKL
ncbi:hypothetical protein FOL47_010754 [Perkinsus chesapeaki]|uniref:Uncharacterized protein n=1 Tax=Perkinsus chesapeaki TaxID=330153 RepID=A0A7J6L2Z4_PERCH|nr:hypothetical protein FOL47_010754 [Perkinsus chesapeaki]